MVRVGKVGKAVESKVWGKLRWKLRELRRGWRKYAKVEIAN
jgi:hypothetical protein